MQKIINLVLIVLLWSTASQAYNTITVLSEKIDIKQKGWNTSDDLILAPKVLGGKLNNFEDQAKSYGLDPRYYNYFFRLQIEESSIPLYVEKSFNHDSSCQVSFFDNNMKLLSQNITYHSIRYILPKAKSEVNLILQCTSKFPRIPIFVFGTKKDFDLTKLFDKYIFFFITGIFLGLLIYNLFIFFITWDRSYLYYIFYISFAYMFNFLVLKYTYIFELDSIGQNHLLLTFCILSLAISLSLFTDKYLNLTQYHTLLKKLLYTLLSFVLIVHIIEYLMGVIALSPLSIAMLILLVIYIGIKSYIDGYKPALYFLLATGGYLVTALMTLISSQGIYFEYTALTKHFITLGLAWDMILLSLALAYRIKMLAEKNKAQDHMLLLQSKFSAVGEMIGNITHQWREPLGGLGAVLASSKAGVMYGNPSKDDLLSSIELSNTIVRHLNETIDTFQNLYAVKNDEQSFKLNDTIEEYIKFVDALYTLESIDISFNAVEECKINGKTNEFLQVILSILHNAKEILLERKTQNPQIVISTKIVENSVTIEISDNAGGIEERYLKNIFDMNYTQKKSGSGMGLYLAKYIVEDKLSGAIDVNNSVDGACFSIVLDIQI